MLITIKKDIENTLDYRFINKELKMIESHKDLDHLKYDKKEHWCKYIFKSVFCCKKRKVLYHEFLEDVENLDEIDDSSINSNYSVIENNKKNKKILM